MLQESNIRKQQKLRIHELHNVAHAHGGIVLAIKNTLVH